MGCGGGTAVRWGGARECGGCWALIALPRCALLVGAMRDVSAAIGGSTCVCLFSIALLRKRQRKVSGDGWHCVCLFSVALLRLTQEAPCIDRMCALTGGADAILLAAR